MNASGNLHQLKADLKRLTDPAKGELFQRFFKTGPGQYSEGDRFRGITVPELRKLAKACRDVSFEDAAALLESPWHEDRLIALFLLIDRYAAGTSAARQRIHRLYLAGIADRVNNWDLVDSSAPQLVGFHLAEYGSGGSGVRGGGPASLLDKLARDKNLWRRRVAIVATWHFIRKGSYGETLRIAESLLGDREDLIHKATGWMLRERGKKDVKPLLAFLERHAATMPRTMLRYAIERLQEKERKAYMEKRMQRYIPKTRKGDSVSRP
jgi:3-methyladenine DNA glycosylase AlkD